MKNEYISFYLKVAGKNLGVSEKFVDFLEKGDAYLKFYFPFEKRKGELVKIDLELFFASKVKGPYFGEIYLKENFYEIINIAFLNALSNSLFDFPFGGMCIKIGVSPNEYSLWEKKIILKNLFEILFKIKDLGNFVFIPGQGLTPELVMILYDEISARSLNPYLHILGKPPEIYGFSEIDNIFCETMIFAIETMLEDYGEKIKDKKITFYGFDKYSSLLIERLYEKGVRNFIINLEEEKFFKVKDEIKSKFTLLLEDEMISYESDIFIICESAKDLTKEKALFLNSRYVIEMKTGGIKPEAEETFAKRNINLLPDVFIKGILNSIYFEEYLKGRESIKDEEIILKVKKKFVEVYRDTLAIGIAKNLSIKKASYMIAIGRIMKLIGMKGV